MKGETTTTMAINMTMRKYWTVIRKVEVTIKHEGIVFHGLYQEDGVSRTLIKEMYTTDDKLCDFGLEFVLAREGF